MRYLLHSIRAQERSATAGCAKGDRRTAPRANAAPASAQPDNARADGYPVATLAWESFSQTTRSKTPCIRHRARTRKKRARHLRKSPVADSRLSCSAMHQRRAGATTARVPGIRQSRACDRAAVRSHRKAIARLYPGYSRGLCQRHVCRHASGHRRPANAPAGQDRVPPAATGAGYGAIPLAAEGDGRHNARGGACAPVSVAVFKTVCGAVAPSRVGSTPMHSRHERTCDARQNLPACSSPPAAAVVSVLSEVLSV